MNSKKLFLKILRQLIAFYKDSSFRKCDPKTPNALVSYFVVQFSSWVNRAAWLLHKHLPTSRHSRWTSCPCCVGSGRSCCRAARRCWTGAGWVRTSGQRRWEEALWSRTWLAEGSRCTFSGVRCSAAPLGSSRSRNTVWSWRSQDGWCLLCFAFLAASVLTSDMTSHSCHFCEITSAVNTWIYSLLWYYLHSHIHHTYFLYIQYAFILFYVCFASFPWLQQRRIQ